MAAATSGPASTTEAPSTQPAHHSPPSWPTPANGTRDDMAHDISESDDIRTFDLPDSDLPPLPTDGDDSFLQQDFHDSQMQSDGSVLMDREMKRQLMDIESSFLPEASAQPDAPQGKPGADDTYLFGGSPGNARPHSPDEEVDTSLQRVMANLEELTKPKKKPKKLEVRSSPTKPKAEEAHDPDSSVLSMEPPTPADAYKTPAARRLDFDENDSPDAGESTSEAVPSSPSAEAARRNQSRTALNENATDNMEEDSVGRDESDEAPEPQVLETKKSNHSLRPTSSASTVKAPDYSQMEEASSLLTSDHDFSMESMPLSLESGSVSSPRANKRPTFLQNRHSSQRSSVSSFTNRSDASGDGASTASLGADYALQTGGAMPRSQSYRSSMGLSRLPSLGSIASSMSSYSDTNPWETNRTISATSIPGLLHPDASLGRVDEEHGGTPPETPRAPSVQPAPTDTVIARHVQDIQVPDTVAREFRAKHSRSPDKRHAATPFTRSKHNLTLKEQNSRIDKLSKENFDLKLKIHFLDQALQNRSDEGVKDMISKNVQLQTDLATEKKETQTLRKKVRDLERRLKAHEEGLAPTKEAGSGSEDDRSDESMRQAELEEEIEFLRERLESNETIIEQWKQDALQKEADSRRMADYIKSMRERSPSGESASRDEAMLREDIEEERARREQIETRCQQAEIESDSLRAELQRLKAHNAQLQQQSTANHHVNKVYSSTRRINQTVTTRSHSGSEGTEQVPTISIGGTSGTLVDHLQNDNDKLQRDLHAQVHMLTSRNRENLRLREENEGLKLTIRRGDAGSAAGDSILERSISRNHMRSVSRASGGTRVTQASDPEREDLETRYAAARDELSQMKLSYKELDDQLNGHLDMLETAENKINELETEIQASTEDLQALSNERDEALELLQDKEQECEELRQEALDTVQRLEIELDEKHQERDRLVVELDNTNEDFAALQQEMKHVSESLLNLEDDRDASLRKTITLENELASANHELDRQDKVLGEERQKCEKLEVQLETCQGEIDFLREEQEGDKIKIGELESAFEHAQITIQDSKERHRDLEERFSAERQQRDVLEGQGKQEADKMINDLNTQLTKLKEDSRRLRKNLSSKEVEAATWKRSLDELEHSLREALGNMNGSRSSLFKDIAKMQRDLEATLQELDNTKNDLAEKEQLLRTRDTLLESTGMESRRLTELLERERQVRRQEQNTFESARRGHQTVTRTVQQHETRVLELETLRSQDRQKLHSLEKLYKEQLLERNNLLYALWNRLSTLCGAEWCRNNALVNGELTSMELISKNIQGFNKNMILAVKTVEGIIGGFKIRIRAMEKDLVRDYQTLEHTLDVRIKRLDQLEKVVQAQRQSMSIGRPSTVRGGLVDLNSAEVTKLRTENKTLRTEVQTLRAITSTTQAGNEVTISRSPSRNGSPTSSKRASMAQTLLRAHSASVVEHLQNQPSGHPYPAAGPLQPSEQKWIHRLKELERRLKAEREARLLDRSGARKRLEQKVEENADLRAALEKERERNEDDVESVHRSGSAMSARPARSRQPSAMGSVRNGGGQDREESSELY